MLYQSEFLTIEKKNNSLVQRWLQQDLTVESFKTEINNFLEVCLKVKPSFVLWLQEEFTFRVPKELHNWIKKTVLSYQFKNGVKDVAFTISKDKMAHLSILNSLEEINTTKQLKFFLNEKEALQYFAQRNYSEKDNEFRYELQPKHNYVNLNVEVSYNLLPKTINGLNALQKQFEFANQNKDKFLLLTQQELQVLRLVCSGLNSKEVALKLFIEPSTVATHRKKINKKLAAKSCVDLYRYALAFNLIVF